MRRLGPAGISRIGALGWVVGVMLLLASHAMPVQAANIGPTDPHAVVVEHLRLQVPAETRQAWIAAEHGSWEPWLEQQPGFLDRQLLWDPAREQGVVLIRWADREHWKAIPVAEVQGVQERFEALARESTGSSRGNPFPLVFEGELLTP